MFVITNVTLMLRHNCL